MKFRFTLIDIDNVQYPIEEPVGWTDVDEFIERSLNHGFTNELDVDTIEFYRAAYKVLLYNYEKYGVNASITMLVELKCGRQWREYYRGWLDFSEWEQDCTKCRVKLSITSLGVEYLFTTRNQQKVNLQSLQSFDGAVLAPYSKLPFDALLPSKAIFLQNSAKTINNYQYLLAAIGADGFNGDFNWPGSLRSVDSTGSAVGYFLIPFPNVTFEEMYLFQPAIDAEYINTQTPETFENIEEFFNNQNNQKCSFEEFDIKLRVKGRFIITGIPTISTDFDIALVKRNGDETVISSLSIPQSGSSGTTRYFDFDFSVDVTETITFGQELVCFISFEFGKLSSGSVTIIYEQDDVSFVNLSAKSYCEPTSAKLFMINEALSRVVEAYTNDELRVLSDYFGRTDSQPYARPEDGCGSLEGITNGLFIRRIEESKPTTPPIFTLSFKDMMDGLVPIHNVGYGLEPDPFRTGKKVVRIEPYEYFYNNSIVFTATAAKEVKIEIIPERLAGNIFIGYEKWEAEEYNGLDEFLTKRNYRTTLKINNKDFADLQLLSKFIASGYAIEITRRKGNSDTSDWRYDNETFIICMKRDDSAIVVELGEIGNPQNIIDPPTIYNYKISPVRNLLRWVQRIFETYKQIDNNAKLVFTSGEGNFYASGIYTNVCAHENDDLAENQDVDITIASDPDALLPMNFIETVSFEYPIKFNERQAILSNLYGLIAWSSNGCEGVGHIKSIKRNPVTGLSKIELFRRRQYTMCDYAVVDITLEEGETFEVNVNGIWKDVTSEIVLGAWSKLNSQLSILQWRILTGGIETSTGNVSISNCR